MLRTQPTTRELHEVYEVQGPLLDRVTVNQSIASESGRRDHLRAFVEAGSLATGEIGQSSAGA